MGGSARAADSRKSMGNEQPQHRPRPKRRRARGQSPDGTPVVRLDIYASSEGAGARQVQPPEPPKPVGTGELDRRKAELDERERALATREVELDRSEGTLVARARGLEERESDLVTRKRELDRSEA